MEIRIETFATLDVPTCYAMLRLRSEVFVVEQECIYQDIDNKDQKAWHILGFQEETLVALTRIFKAGDYFAHVSIGRVVVDPNFRGQALGHRIMEASLDFIRRTWGEVPVEISAQQYLEKFYMEHGFKKTGDPYLEDGIPHIRMIRS